MTAALNLPLTPPPRRAEFGKGTSAVDGVCLLAAAIRHLLRAATVPRTVITTHFREVFDHGLLDVHGGGGGGSSGGSSELDVAYFQMQVILSRGGGATSTAPASLSSSAADAATDYEDDVTPLFRLAPGRAGSSHGLACALRAGMPRRITDRAAAVSSMLKRGAVVTPLPGYLDDASRRAHERMQMRLLQALLAPPAWEPPADGGAAAGADDLAAVLGLLDAMCHG